MICVFDTETTGLPNKRSPRLEMQPHIMQLAISLYDESRRPVFELSTLVALPEHVGCSPEALATHGITPELSREYGMPAKKAIGMLRFAMRRAKIVVAHNLQFDEKLVDFACKRNEEISPLEGAGKFCTLEATTDLLRLPPTEAMIKWGHGDKFKSPKLEETYRFLFGETFEGAHDALVDTRACARVYFELLDRGLVTG